MAAPNFNAERAASILVDATYLGDPAAAAKWHVSARTIRNYRARLETDEEFAVLFRAKARSAEGEWGRELNRALGSVIRKLGMIADAISVPDDAGMIAVEQVEALATAAKALGEIAITREVLGADHAQPRANVAAQGGDAARDARPAN